MTTTHRAPYFVVLHDGQLAASHVAMSAAAGAALAAVSTHATDAAVLCAAAAAGDGDALARLLREGGISQDALDRGLSVAAESNQVGAVRLLLKAGGRLQKNALEAAAGEGNVALLAALCSEGASTRALNIALKAAMQHEQLDSARWLIAAGGRLHDDHHAACPLHAAARFGCERMLAEFLAEEDDPAGVCAARCLTLAGSHRFMDCALLLAARFRRLPRSVEVVRRHVDLTWLLEEQAVEALKLLADAYPPHVVVGQLCVLAESRGRTDLVEWALQWLRADPARMLRVNLLRQATCLALPMRACGAVLDAILQSSRGGDDNAMRWVPEDAEDSPLEWSRATTALLMRRVEGYGVALEFGSEWRCWKDAAILGSRAIMTRPRTLPLFGRHGSKWWLEALLSTSFKEYPESVANYAGEQAPAALIDCERAWFTDCGAEELLPELAAFHYRYTFGAKSSREDAIGAGALPTDDDDTTSEHHAVERAYRIGFSHVLLRAYKRSSRHLAWLLLSACKHGHVPLASFLLTQAGVDCDGHIDDGSAYASDVSPIHVAACSSNIRTLRLLLQHGADPTVRVRFDQSDVVPGDVVAFADIAPARHGAEQAKPRTALSMALARNNHAAAQLLARAAAWRRRRHMLALRQRWLQSDAAVFSLDGVANSAGAAPHERGPLGVDKRLVSPPAAARTAAGVGSPLAIQLAQAALLGRYSQFMALCGDRSVAWTGDALGCALACAAKAGLLVFVDRLLKGAADESACEAPLPAVWLGRALMLAAARQHVDVMLALHDSGARFDAADTGAHSAVAVLAEVCSDEAMEAAIFCGLDVNDADPTTGALVYQPSLHALMVLLQAPSLDWSRPGALALVLKACFERALLPFRRRPGFDEDDCFYERNACLSAALARGLDANAIITSEACTAALGIAAGVAAADAWVGSTMLHAAAAGGSDALASELLTAGADASIPNARGLCAWQVAQSPSARLKLCRAAVWSRRRHLLALRGKVADSRFADDAREGPALADGGCVVS